MILFVYTCIDASSGREISGQLEARDCDHAVAALKARGLHPIQLDSANARAPETPVLNGGKATAPSRLRPSFRSRSAGYLDRKALTEFTRQLASLLRAGLPLLRGIEVLARQARRPGPRHVLKVLADGVRSGDTLSATMARESRSFSGLYVAMVKAGEAAGVLDVVLERLGRFLEKSDRLRGRVKAALVYPAMIALVAGGVVAALMVFVVPKFETVFASLLKGEPLPVLTQGVLATGRFLQSHALVVLGGPLALIVIGSLLLRSLWVRRICDRWMLALPGLGGLTTKSLTAHLTRTLGTLLTAGVPLLQALQITRETSGNTCVADAMQFVHGRIEAGESFAGPLAATRVFPELVPCMIEVGEETGALPDMLGRIADTYDDEVDAAVAGLTALIEPFTIALMAVVVGTIVIAMFLPIVSIIQTLT